MGLLDFDDEKILRESGIRKSGRQPSRRDAVLDDEERFAALQNLGHEENSKDFSDSPFADRKKLCPSCLAGFSKDDIKGSCTCV